MKQCYVYILSNFSKMLYIGITSDLEKRIYQHKKKLVKGFTEKYNLTKLVYFEVFRDPYNAISREKQIKGWLRSKKIELIQKVNPNWKDISIDWKILRPSASE